MRIDDPEHLIPDLDELCRVVSSHPLDAVLASRIRTVFIRRSERCGIPQENIDINDENVTLGVGEATQHKSNYQFILYHEFSHIADRLRPEFRYSDDAKRKLTDSERICLMELWNLHINSRLNRVGLYDPSRSTCIGTLNGVVQKFPADVGGELMAHMAILEREGFAYEEAKGLVEDLWQRPEIPLTYVDIIEKVKKGLGEPAGAGDV